MKKYETFSTTADMGLKIAGKDFCDLYENAVRGLNFILFGNDTSRPSTGEVMHFSYQGDSVENVLVNLLAQVLSLAYQKKMRVAAVRFIRAGERFLEAELRLVLLRRQPKIEIKSVTYHNLHVVEKDGFKQAALVFDI